MQDRKDKIGRKNIEDNEDKKNRGRKDKENMLHETGKS